MVGCQPKGNSGVVRNVGAGFVMAQQPAELTTMTPSHPYAAARNPTTTPVATPSLGVPRTPSPSRSVRASAPSPSPEGPRGRRRARAPSPSPDRSKRVKTKAASPSPPAPVRAETATTTTTAPPPPTPSSVSSPSVFLRPAPESTPPSTFSFVAAPPAAQPKPEPAQPKPQPVAPPATQLKAKPKSPWQALLDEATNAPPPEKPRKYQDGIIPGFARTLRMNETPPVRSAPIEPLPSRIPGLSLLAAAVSPAAPPPPPPSPPKVDEVDTAPPLQVNPAAFLPQAALPACLTPPQQQQPVVRPPLPQPKQQQQPPPPPPQSVLCAPPPQAQNPFFRAVQQQQQQQQQPPPQSVFCGPRPQPQPHPFFRAVEQQQQQQPKQHFGFNPSPSPQPQQQQHFGFRPSPPPQPQQQHPFFRSLQQQQPQQQTVFRPLWQQQQQPAARPPPPSEDVEIVDAPPSALHFVHLPPPKDDEVLGDAPPEQELSAEADIELQDAPEQAEAPFSVDAGELLDADNEKEDELLPDAVPGQVFAEAAADEEQLPDAAPRQVEAPTLNFNIINATSSSPQSQTLADTSPRSLSKICGQYLKKARSNPNRMVSSKSPSPTGPTTPTGPTSPTTPTRPLSPTASSNRSRSPTAESAASSAPTRRGKTHRSGRQRKDQARRRSARQVREMEEEQKKQEEEEKERRFADLEAENARLVADQASSSDKIAALEAQLADANELAASATKARDVAQSNADKLDKKLAREVAADEATKQALAKVNAELDSANDKFKALKDEKAQLDEHLICIETDHAFDLDTRDSLAEEWEQKLKQLEQRAQNAEAALDSARHYIANEAPSCDALQKEVDNKQIELQQEKLKAEDLQTELDQRKSRWETETRSFQFAVDLQTKKVFELTAANEKLTDKNGRLQQKVDTERAHIRQLQQHHEDSTNELRSLNVQLQKELKQHVGKTRMPKQQQAGPSDFSYGQFQRDLNGTQNTSSKITNELHGASDEMELEMATAAKANRSKDIAIQALTRQLAESQAQLTTLKVVLADYEAASPPSSPLPAAFSSTALSTTPSAEAPESDSEDASEPLQLTSAQQSSSAAPSTTSASQPSDAAVIQTTVECSTKLTVVNESSSAALATVSSPEPKESTLVTALVQPSSSAALPTTSANDTVRELQEFIQKARDDMNSRVDRIEGGIDALEASMNKSRTPASTSSIGESVPASGSYVSSVFGQALHFFLMLLLFLFLLITVAIGHSMQEELWHEANALSQDVSFSAARAHITAFGQVAVLVLFIITRWRS